MGCVTITRGISVHRKDCHSIQSEDETKRLVKVDWGSTRQLHQVRLRIEAWDRVGLLRDITTLVSADKVNIAAMVTQENNEEGTATVSLTLFTLGIDQLSRLFTKLEGIQGVLTVTRSDPPQPVSPSEKAAKAP